MSTPSTFQPTTAWLREQLASGESLRCEFKRQWHDLGSKGGKGEFVKDVIALANSATDDEPGCLVFGVAERPDGCAAVPLGSEPQFEAVTQILSEYTAPPVSVRLARVEVDGTTVSVLITDAHAGRPHHVSRDIGEAKRETVFVRRGTVVGTATALEFEEMIRQKFARGGPPGRGAAPLRVEVLSVPGMWDWRVILRLMNVTRQPLTSVTATLNVKMPAFPQVFLRRTTLDGATLYAGESREVTVDLAQEYFEVDGKRLSIHDNVKCRWLDLSVTVQYRDENGLMQEVSACRSTGG